MNVLNSHHIFLMILVTGTVYLPGVMLLFPFSIFISLLPIQYIALLCLVSEKTT